MILISHLISLMLFFSDAPDTPTLQKLHIRHHTTSSPSFSNTHTPPNPVGDIGRVLGRLSLPVLHINSRKRSSKPEAPLPLLLLCLSAFRDSYLVSFTCGIKISGAHKSDPSCLPSFFQSNIWVTPQWS